MSVRKTEGIGDEFYLFKVGDLMLEIHVACLFPKENHMIIKHLKILQKLAGATNAQTLSKSHHSYTVVLLYMLV